MVGSRIEAKTSGTNESRTPTTTEAVFAAEEAKTLTGLIVAASGNLDAFDLVDDDTLQTGALMLLNRVQVMRAYIAASPDMGKLREESKGTGGDHGPEA